MSLHLTLKFLLIFITTTYFLILAKPICPNTNSVKIPKNIQDLAQLSKEPQKDTIKLESLQILSGNTTISSENNTFKLGFFSPNDSSWYLGIWYASIPIPKYVWVANRENPIKNLSSAIAQITENGKLVLTDGQDSRNPIWESNNLEKASYLQLLEQGNLVLSTSDDKIVWQSFDFPTDTWLPGMYLTANQRLTSWKSSIDPSPGRYSLRLIAPDYGEIGLFYENGTIDDMNVNLYTYWTTGNWSGNSFASVPEMTIPYIYRFKFIDPFTPMATFGYSEVPLESEMSPPLTRFLVDYTGQLRQFTWSQQIESWNMFWSQPENQCVVYGLCGNLGFCSDNTLSPCECVNGFKPVDNVSWGKEDFSEGCWREGNGICSENDEFEEIGSFFHERTMDFVSFSGSRSECERACLGNCSCIGLFHNLESNFCKNLYGSLFNLRNFTSESTLKEKLYLRVQRIGTEKKNTIKRSFLIGMIFCGIFATLIIGIINFLYMKRRNVISRRKGEEDGVFQATTLRVFSYKELHSATRGFSEKLGHGGFGAVFRGVLLDSSLVAVKRLERPGGGEKEFRAEVCTIGNIQHVNLVRLRGFCSENSHRLLVYDYMPNGPLSMYLKPGGSHNLSWDVRFRAAVATARGIAYLHEACRNCIIHCDIKPENILLDEDFSAKVSDFGLAKLIGRDFSRVLATMRGTWGYVAPEWISGVAITTKADVYSYGMTLLELIGGRRNVEGGPPSSGGGSETEKWFFPPWAARKIIEGDFASVIDERLNGMYNEAEASRVGLVAIWCIQDDEATRPTMGMVVKMLEGVVEVTVPPPPKLLQALVSGETFQGLGTESGNIVSIEYAGDFDDNGSNSVDSKVSKLST